MGCLVLVACLVYSLTNTIIGLTSVTLSLVVLFLLGLSPDLQSMEQIRRIMRPTDVPDTGEILE